MSKVKKVKDGRAAVVTGAGSGLGAATAKKLKKLGWTVYGTYIEGQSTEEMEKAGIIPVLVDITSQESVEALYARLDKELGDKGLAALINVAGNGEVAGGIMEGLPDDRIQKIFDINVFGTFRMIREGLPLLRKYGHARIINVTSSGTRTPVPFSGMYATTKYAEMGFTNAFRYELAPFGIQMCGIEPGAMRTPMTADPEENEKKTWDRMPKEVRDLYYDKVKGTLKTLNLMMAFANKPEKVADVIMKALYTKKMKMRYVAGHDVSMLPLAQRVLGENGFEAMMMTMLGLKEKN